jgi:hypothetical protein
MLAIYAPLVMRLTHQSGVKTVQRGKSFARHAFLLDIAIYLFIIAKYVHNLASGVLDLTCRRSGKAINGQQHLCSDLDSLFSSGIIEGMGAHCLRRATQTSW